jgi:hypothetical protein
MKRKLLLALLISTETMICITLGVVLAKTIREEDSRSIIIIEQPIEYNINSNNSYDDSYNYEGDDIDAEEEVDDVREEISADDDIIIKEDKTINTEVESNVKKRDEVVKYIYKDTVEVEEEAEIIAPEVIEEDVVEVKHIVKPKKQEEKEEEREIIHTYEECPFIGKTLTPQERLEASKRYACACVH